MTRTPDSSSTDESPDGDSEVQAATNDDEVRHVSLVRALQNDPVNENPEGSEWFVPGEHHGGSDYEVMAEDGSIISIPTETVCVVTLPHALPESEATERVVDQLNEVRNLEADTDEEAA